MVANASNVILTRRGRIQGLNFAISKLYWILRRFAPQNDTFRTFRLCTSTKC